MKGRKDGTMVRDDCIFCKLANGVFPTNTIYEDDEFKVFLDVSPATKGHCLIVPKDHYANLEDISDEASAKVLPLAKKIMKTLKEKLNCEGLNLVQNNGEIAGQTVFHFHMHVIPRYKGDGQLIGWRPQTPEDGELEETLKQILS